MLVHNKKGWPKTKKTQRLFKEGPSKSDYSDKNGQACPHIVNNQILTMLNTWTNAYTYRSCGTVSTFYSQCEGNGVLHKHLLVIGPAICRGPGTQVLFCDPATWGLGKPKGVRGYGAVRTEPDDSSDWVPFLKCTYISFHLKQQKPISFLPLCLETSLSGYN